MPEPTPCGDLALTFGPTRPTRSRLEAGWVGLTGDNTITGAAPWSLWRSPPTPAWAGYGLARADSADGFTLTLGRPPDHWLTLTWNRVERQWTVRTDRFGTLQAYAGPGIVSTFSPATWGPDPALDWPALAGFTRLGWYPADRMPVEGTRLLRPATDERWSAGGTPLGASRWQDWAHTPDAGLSFEDAADRVLEVLTAVLDEQVGDDRVGLPVSGGLDSRLTVAALTRPDSPVPQEQLWAYAYGYDATSPELRIAGAVAEARGLPLHAATVPPYLFERFDEVLAATEGLVDLTLPRQAAVTPALADQTQAVIAAHWGDVWFGAPTPVPDAGAAETLLAASTRRGHQWLTDHLVVPHLGQDPEPALRDLLAAESGRVDHLDDPVIAHLALKTEQWSLRWTEATLRAYQAAVPPRLPFYDPRVADVFLGLPSTFLQGRRLQIDVLRRRAPDLARVEWEAVETDLFSLRHERTWRLPRRAARRAWRRLRPPTARRQNWEVQLLGPAGAAGLDRWLLEPGAAIHDLVARQEVAALVARLRAEPTDAGLGYAVATLLTLGAWKERFT